MSKYLLINRFKQLRHQLMIDDKKEFALKAGLKNYSQYLRYEKHEIEPDILTYWIALQHLRLLIPGLRLEDLLEPNPDPEKLKELLGRYPSE